MIHRKCAVFILVAALFAVPALAGETFDLQFDRLAASLEALNSQDRDIVSDAIALIKDGEHVLALSRLSSLKQRSPQNSSLRIMAAYALLQAGNLVGAFEEAEKAHAAPHGNAYKCWFLGKVALLNGRNAVCERELEHVKQSGQMVAEAQQLEKELAKN